MNEALIRLVRKYEDRADRCQKRGVIAGAIYYRQAAKQVLALAMQS